MTATSSGFGGMCKLHPGNPLELFCNEESCSKEICKKCIPEHPKHHILLNETTAKAEQTGMSTTQQVTKDLFKGELNWTNGTKIFTHDKSDYTYITDTSTTLLPDFFTVQVKVLKLKEQNGTLIGISKRKVGTRADYRLCREDDNQYALCNFADGRLFMHCEEWKSYGCSYFEGDVLTITLDKTKTLSFAVNGDSCGVAATNVRGYFYLAVTTNCNGNSFEILSVKKI